MKYFVPLHVESLNRKVWLNFHAFDPTMENIARLKRGNAPIGNDEKPLILHHLNRGASKGLVMLTDTFHRQHSDKIHNIEPMHNDKVDRRKFKSERKKAWKAIGAVVKKLMFVK